MINFDAEKLSKEMIFITNFRSNGLISFYENIQDWRNKKKPKTKYINPNIYQSLYKLFFQGISFTYPRMSYFLKYDNTVIDLDILLQSQFKHENGTLIKLSKEEIQAVVDKFKEEHETFIDQLKSKIETVFDKNKQLAFDGKYIIDLSKATINNSTIQNENGKFIELDSSGFLFYSGYRAISIKMLHEVRRYVMHYEIEHPETKIKHYSYFPSDGSRVFNDKYEFDLMMKEQFINLKFLIQAADIVAKNFSYKDLEPLNIEEVLLNLDVLSIKSIDDTFLDFYIYSDNIVSLLSWIAGLINKSENLEQLSSLKRIIQGFNFNFEKKANGKTKPIIHLTHYSEIEKIQANDNFIPKPLDIGDFLSKTNKNKLQQQSLFDIIQSELKYESDGEEATTLIETEMELL